MRFSFLTHLPTLIISSAAAETIHNDSHDSLTMTTTATKQQPETTNSPAITNESEPRPQVPSHQEAATSNKMWSMGSENCQIDETRAAAMVDPRLAENHQDYQRSFEKTDPQQDTEHQANEGLLDTMKEGEQQATTVPELNGLHDEDRDHHHHQQQQQQQLNGTPTGGDDDVELDEDVREAKANVKEYLDRIRETEKFIKSMHEEEEKFQRQRQESFLFNNLILSTKLNGFAKTSTNGQMNGFDSPIKPSCGPYSAPVTMMSRSSYLIDSPNHHHYASDSLHSNGVGTGCNPTMMGSMVDSSYGGEIIEQPSLSCFNSDLYKPTSSIIHTPLHMLHTPSLLAGSTSAAFAAATTTNYKDPLEPVKPISMHAYAPPARQWHRSKSVLGDRFHSGYDLVSQARKPLSADIDSAHSATSQSNAYFPSRQRRSVSQARYQTPAVPCSTSYAVSSLVPGGSLSSCLDDSTTMVSEYKSSFGPNLHQQYRDRRHQRHHSLAPTSSLSSRPHIQRSTSPYRGSLSSEYKRPAKEAADDIDKDVHDNDDNDDDDPEMNAYRPGSYVPRVVPETWSSSRERGGRGRSISNSCNVLAGARDKSPITKSETTISRRRSVQTMGGRDSSDVSQTIEDTVASDGTVELVAPRRRSWTTTNETNKTTTAGASASASAAVSGSGSAGTNSRLSELEQRIQANKRRRAELLQGISSSAAAEEPRRDSKTTWSPSRRRGNHRESDNDEDDEDDELNQSGGFERPSRPVERDTSTQLNHDLSPRRSGSLVPGDGGVGDTRLATAPSSMATNRFRASRIESMEARIKRRSYCVRVKSPERRAMSKCDGK